MKYKVLLGVGGGSYASLTFYTSAQATQCCQAWVENSNHFAWLWNGSTWTNIT